MEEFRIFDTIRNTDATFGQNKSSRPVDRSSVFFAVENGFASFMPLPSPGFQFD